MDKRTCKHCHKSIAHRAKSAHYCNKSCRDAANYRRQPAYHAPPQRDCVECGTSFKPLRAGASKHCSSKCYMLQYRRDHPGYNGQKLVALHEANCDFCGEAFRTKSHNRMFCSRACMQKDHRKRQSEEYKPYEPVDHDLIGKRCTACLKYQFYDQFRVTPGRGVGERSARCAACLSAAQRERHHVMKHDDAYAEANRVGRKARIYNISHAEVRHLESATSCEICNADVDYRKRNLHIDHCHTTGAVRGVLCFRCNTGVGNLADSPELAIRAAEYLLRQVDVLAAASELNGRRII